MEIYPEHRWAAGTGRPLWESVSKYCRYCRMYGVSSATRLAWRRLRKPKGAPPIRTTPLAPPPAAASGITRIDKTISVIIPTRNAAPDFSLLARKLKAQVGVRLSEIIVVDSGSTDHTTALAQAEGAKLIQIQPGEFTHSVARNRGAEAASGDFLLFMVQDALPLTGEWLWEMATALQSNELAAVSCAEYPRSDSDLFYQFLIHQQYDSAGLNHDRLLAWDDSCSSYLGLRSNAQLSNVAALIRGEVFARYRYRTAYAEDLDLGVRLIRDGWKLGFLHRTRVLHSHNRTAAYFLRRGYADARHLPQVFANFVYPEVERKERLCADMFLLYRRMALLHGALERAAFPQPTMKLLQQLRALLCAGECEGQGGLADAELDEMISGLCETPNVQHAAYAPDTNMLAPHVLRHFDEFRNWLCAIYEEADEDLARSIVNGVEKIFALHCGNHLAYLFLTAANRGGLDESLSELDKRLGAGV